MTPRRRTSSSRPFHDLQLRHLGTSAVATLAGLGIAAAGFAGATVAASSKRDASPQRVARVVVANHVTALARGWYAYGSGTEIAQTGKTQLGVKAVRTQITRQTDSGGAAFDAGAGGLSVTPSTRYSLTAWVRGTGALKIRVGLHNSSGHAIGFARVRGTGLQFHPSPTRWTPYHLTFATNARTSSIVVLIGGRGRQRASFLVGSMKLTSRVLSDGRHRSPRPHKPETTNTTTTTTPTTTSTTTTTRTTTPTTSTTTTTTTTTTTKTKTTTTTTAPATTTTPPPPTTTTRTTTTTATTPAPSSTSYAAAISYTQTRPAFTTLRTVNVTSASELTSALSGIKCGDLVQATSSFTVSSELVINQNPSCPAVVELSGVTMAYTGSSSLPSVWIHDASNIWLYGGDVHGPAAGQPGGGGIAVYHASNIRWWGFHVHNVAHDGLDLFPVSGAIDGCDFQGEIDHWGGYIADDPHAEKGTGYHGANIADAGTGIVTNTRIALYVHDGPTGAGVQIGAPSSSGRISGLTLYLKAASLTMRAQSQVAGNALQEWGAAPIGMRVAYLEANDLEGRAIDGEGVYSGVSMAGIRADYGRATNTNQNPYLSRTESGISASQPWDARDGQVYGDVS